MRVSRAVAATLLMVVMMVGGAATAQLRPIVESISPDGGPPAGGTVVTIRGKNLAPIAPPAPLVGSNCTPCPPVNPVVTFGGKAGGVISYSNEEIVVTTPPNAGGTYDVEVGSLYHRSLILPRGYTYGGNSLDRVLVPLIADRVPGAFGSIWSTELVGRNDNDDPLFISQRPELQTDPGSYGAARTTFRPVLQDNGAAFLYHQHVERNSGMLPPVFNLRVRDLSRQADSWGSEIPVVRVDDTFVDEPIHLLNVPFEPESRVTLRIYDFDGEVGGSVPVIVYENDSTIVLGFTTVDFPQNTGYIDFPFIPGYRVVDVGPIISNRPSTLKSIRIQVGERFHQKRLWAFAAVTDLETQQVTVISPDRAKR